MPTTVNLGKLRLDWRGDYNPSTAYVVNDVVTYRQQQWVCTQPITAAVFTANQAGFQLNVTAIASIATQIPIFSTANGTVVTVASTQGLYTGATLVITGASGGGLSAGTYYVGSVISSTTLTLSSTYNNAVAGTYLTFTANTFGSSSTTSPYMTGTIFTAYGTLALGQVIANTNTPVIVTSAVGNGVTATLTFPIQTAAPYIIGQSITVQGINPVGYNGTYLVTNCTTTTVTYANITTMSMQTGSQGVIFNTSGTGAVSTIVSIGTTGGSVGTYRTSASATISSTTFSTLVAATPTIGSTYWTTFTQLFNNMSTWQTGQTYAVGDTVVYATPASLLTVPASIAGNYSLSRTVTQAYYCTTAHTASLTGTIITPIDSSYWTPVNRKGSLGTQLSPQSLSGTYNLGVYGNSSYSASVLPNRGIAFDATSQYYGGSTKNTTDSLTFGMVASNGQAYSWGYDVNGSGGMVSINNYAMNALTFPFYDWWRSTSNSGGTGVHATPDGNTPRVIQWEKSYDRNLVLMNSGEIFAWGYGGSGENGNGAASNVGYPVRVGGTNTAVYNNTAPGTNASGLYTSGHALQSTRFKRISMNGGCGYGQSGGHSMALDENGFVWTWGNNSFGQLGLLSINALNTTATIPITGIPQQLPKSAFGGLNVVAIWACGAGGTSTTSYGWSYAVTSDGNLWAWGYGGVGHLGLGNSNNYGAPQQITSVGGGGGFGSGSIGSIVKLQFTDNAAAVGQGAVAILTSTGQIYCAGLNVSGWMGFATTPVNTWTNVGGGPGNATNSTCRDMWLYGSGGTYTSMMQRDSVTGNCWTAGWNQNGQLGYGGTGTASSNTFTTAKMQIAGTQYVLTNVKHLAFAGRSSNIVATVVCDNGIGFSIGYNTSGTASIGVNSSTYTANTDTNGIEITNTYVWQPLRSPPGMQGNLANCVGAGYDALVWLCWQNNDGRIMFAGSANIGTNQGGHVTGQYNNGYFQRSNVTAMSTPIVE